MTYHRIVLALLILLFIKECGSGLQKLSNSPKLYYHQVIYIVFTKRTRSFACIKIINKLRDCRVGRNKYIPQVLIWQCLQQSYYISMGPPYWCTSLIHQYGAAKSAGLREEKKILLPKS